MLDNVSVTIEGISCMFGAMSVLVVIIVYMGRNGGSGKQ